MQHESQERCSCRRRGRHSNRGGVARANGGVATHLHKVDDHREEVIAEWLASTRLGLEPRSHRQQLPLERQHHKLTKDEKWWSDEDGSDESSRRGHGCGKSQGGTNDDGGSMSCRANSIRISALPACRRH